MRLIGPGDGEIVGDTPDRRVEILSDHDSLNATWSRFGPGREGADLHIHRRHTDLFFVLEGEFTLRLGLDDQAATASAGQLVRVPPYVVHGFRNASDADVVYLNFHAPGCEFADYMRAMRDGRKFSYDQVPPPADGGRPTSEVVIGEPVADVEAIHIEEVELGPGDLPPEPHLESLYVLEGEIEPGTWLQFPPDTERSISGAARCLRLRTPGRSA